MSITTPHFALPFRYNKGKPACVEQDSIDDIAVCIEAILRTTPGGSRLYNPRFGVPDPTFEQRPVNTNEIANRVEAWEARAQTLFEEDQDRFDTLVTRIRATVTTEEVNA